jgi:hypothetical protein
MPLQYEAMSTKNVMRRTSLISGTLIDPDKSCLFANINSVAPANLYAIPPPAVPAMLISETTATAFQPKGLPPSHLLFQQTLQLIPAIRHPQPIGRVHHPDNSVGRFKVVSPIRTEGSLTAYVPDVESVAVYKSLSGM